MPGASWAQHKSVNEQQQSSTAHLPESPQVSLLLDQKGRDIALRGEKKREEKHGRVMIRMLKLKSCVYLMLEIITPRHYPACS